MAIYQLEIRVSGQSQGPCAAKDVTIETLVITIFILNEAIKDIQFQKVNLQIRKTWKMKDRLHCKI